MRRMIAFISMFMMVFGLLCCLAAAEIAKQPMTSSYPEIRIGLTTALDIGVVIVLLGIAGAWWTLKQGISEQRILLLGHAALVTHRTSAELDERYLQVAVYDARHQVLIDGIARIEAALLKLQS